MLLENASSKRIGAARHILCQDCIGKFYLRINVVSFYGTIEPGPNLLISLGIWSLSYDHVALNVLILVHGLFIRGR